MTDPDDTPTSSPHTIAGVGSCSPPPTETPGTPKDDTE